MDNNEIPIKRAALMSPDIRDNRNERSKGIIDDNYRFLIPGNGDICPKSRSRDRLVNLQILTSG